MKVKQFRGYLLVLVMFLAVFGLVGCDSEELTETEVVYEPTETEENDEPTEPEVVIDTYRHGFLTEEGNLRIFVQRNHEEGRERRTDTHIDIDYDLIVELRPIQGGGECSHSE